MIKSNVNYQNNTDSFSELKESMNGFQYKQKRNKDLNELERRSYPELNNVNISDIKQSPIIN